MIKTSEELTLLIKEFMSVYTIKTYEEVLGKKVNQQLQLFSLNSDNWESQEQLKEQACFSSLNKGEFH